MRSRSDVDCYPLLSLTTGMLDQSRSEDAWGITWGIVFKDWVKTGLVMFIAGDGSALDRLFKEAQWIVPVLAAKTETHW